MSSPSWPRNVRERKNALERTEVLSQHAEVQIVDPGLPTENAINRPEEILIPLAVAETTAHHFRAAARRREQDSGIHSPENWTQHAVQEAGRIHVRIDITDGCAVVTFFVELRRSLPVPRRRL